MTEGGTLYQLRTLTNQRNITADPSKNVDACEDFIETDLHAHILCAAMIHLKAQLCSGHIRT